MQKGPVREGKGTAIIRFFLWLAVLLILLLVAYFLVIEKNYTNSVEDPQSTWRSYVVVDTTPGPTPTLEPSLAPAVEPGVPTPTLPPYATPTATPEVTVKPTPTPTPAPTAIPVEEISNGTAFTAGALAKNAPVTEQVVGGISQCYVSPQNQYTVMQVDGWAYLDVEGFDGQTSAAFLYFLDPDTSQGILYNTSQEPGISQVEHAGQGTNLEYADFRCCMETAAYPDGVYRVAVVVEAQVNGERRYFSKLLDENCTFTVRDGEVISPIPTTAPQEPAQSAAPVEPQGTPDA